ncbi:MAG: PAS domain S-box protein [Chloroherpetonaceae bacterium]|nr:PAS domain S-box protein [Chloroherpetonaceae bacterium]
MNDSILEFLAQFHRNNHLKNTDFSLLLEDENFKASLESLLLLSEESLVYSARNENGNWVHEFQIGTIQKTLGLPPNSHSTTEDWHEIIHPDDFQILDKSAQDSFKGQSGEYVLRLKAQNNFFVDFLDRRKVLCDETGKPIRLLGRLIPLSTKKQFPDEASREDYFQVIFEESTEAKFIVNLASNLIENCNNRAVELFEVDSKNDLIGSLGMRFQKYPFTEKEVEEIWFNLNGNKPWAGELEYISAKGTPFYGGITIKKISINSRAFLLVRVFDITALKKAEEKIKQSEEKLSWLLNALPFSISLYQEKQLLFANRAFAESRGIPFDIEEIRRIKSLQHLPEYTLIHEDDRNAFMEKLPYYRKMIDEGDLVKVERRIRKYEQNDFLWYECTIFKGIYVDGKAMVVEVDIPIDDRKKAEERISKSEWQFRSVFDNAAVGIVFAQDNRILNVNAGFEEIIGYSKDELIHLDWRTITFSEDLEKELLLLSEMREGKRKNYTLEKRFIHKNGSIVWTEITASMFYDEYASPLGVVVAKNITAQKEAESLLREKQNQLQLIFDTVFIGICLTDETGMFIDVNSSFCKTYGYSREELIGNHFTILVPTKERLKLSGIYESFIKGDIHFGGEWMLLRKDGELRRIHVTSGLIDGAKGRKYKVTTVQDITDQKQNEEQLFSRNALISSLSDGLPDVMLYQFKVDQYGKEEFTFVSKGVEKISQISVEEALGSPNTLHQLLLPESLDRVNRLTKKSLETLDVFETVIEKKLRDGTQKWSLIRSVPRKQENGDVIWDGVEIDITKQRQNEELLIQSKQLLEQTEEIAQIGSWRYNPKTNDLEWSSQVYRLYEVPFTDGKLSPNEMFNLVIEPNDVETIVRSSIEMKKSFQLRKKIVTSRGNQKWLEVFGSPILNEKGELISYNGYIQDITREKAIEEEKELIYQQLLQSQKMESLGVLASGVAHEFNNILMGIMGNAELLQRDNSLESKQGIRIKTIQENSLRAANIIRQMLGFARQGKKENIAVKISECIRDVSQMILPMLDKRITLETELPSEELILEGDKGQIEQVLLNLMVNARDAILDSLKHTKQAGKLSVSLSRGSIKEEYCAQFGVSTNSEFIQISITDNGIGIPMEIREKIFEPFFSTKEVGKGTGLGLSMVYGIVKNHNGFITLESTPGEGTTFYLYFPIGSEKRPSSSTPLTTESLGFKRSNILVIDDELLIRNYLKEILEANGHRVTLSANGRKAIDLVENTGREFDIILLDKNMPVLNGEKTYELLHSILPNAKFILMTGYLDKNAPLSSLETERFQILTKPFSLTELYSVINSN